MKTKTAKYIKSFLTQRQALSFARRFVGGTVRKIGHGFSVFGKEKIQAQPEVTKEFWLSVESTELRVY